MSKTFLRKPVLLLLALATLLSCKKHEHNPGDSSSKQELGTSTKISAGEPFFTVSPGTPLNIHRVAWTGEKLWAVTGIGNGDVSQKLIEIDTSDGSILQSIPFNQSDNPKQMFSLDYANGQLLDTYWAFPPSEEKYAKTYDTATAAATGQWNYSGKYELYYYLTYDGTHYWGGTNYEFEGSNCQAIVAYDDSGSVVKAFELCGEGNNGDKGFPYGNDCIDMVYGGGNLWASRRLGDNYIISKLDSNLTILQSYHIVDGDKFGEAQYSGEIAVHLEYINDRLWLVDRFNNFYKTAIR